MVTIILVATIALLAGASGYLLGTLREREIRLTDAQAGLTAREEAIKAYQNRLLERQGVAPIFNEGGEIVLDGEKLPFKAHILRPPFAQAEYDWEEEDEANRAIAFSDLGLTPDDKERIRNTYKP